MDYKSETELWVEKYGDTLYQFAMSRISSKETAEDLVHILTKPKNALMKQYKKLFELDGVELTVEEEALKSIAELTIKRKTGARGLRAIMENIMLDTMYELPELNGYEIVINDKCVTDKEKPAYIKSKKIKRKGNATTLGFDKIPSKNELKQIKEFIIALFRHKLSLLLK